MPGTVAGDDNREEKEKTTNEDAEADSSSVVERASISLESDHFRRRTRRGFANTLDR